MITEVVSFIIGAVYVCTEDAFPSKRLQQLIDQQHKLRADVPPEVIQKIRFGNNIFVEHAADLVSRSTDCKYMIIMLQSSNHKSFLKHETFQKATSELRSITNNS